MFKATKETYSAYYIPKDVVKEIHSLLVKYPHMVENSVRELYFEAYDNRLITIERFDKVDFELGQLFDLTVLVFSFVVRSHINGVVTVPLKVSEEVINK